MRGHEPGRQSSLPDFIHSRSNDLPVWSLMENIESRVLEAVARLRPGTTMCPGALARSLGTDAPTLRPVLDRLQRAGQITIRQSGQIRESHTVKGPFRVAPALAPASPSLPAQHAGWIGVDYSGAGAPDSAQPGLCVFIAHGNHPPEEIPGPLAGGRWSRQAFFNWLHRLVDSGVPFVIGIDHALGVPWAWARRHGLSDWDAVLRLVSRRWPADRHALATLRRRHPFPPAAEGCRTCDLWTVGAKSVFHFDVPGSVATSTFSGLPWIARLRAASGARVHFWPFDGWSPAPDRAVIAEVYPSLWRRRFPAPQAFSPDQRDAWTVAAWMQWVATGNHWDRYWHPPLSAEEKQHAAVEGWILGVT